MKNLLKKAGFRCPFHKEAMKQKTFYQVILAPERSTRLVQMRDAIQHFYTNPSIPALAFVIPDELLGSFDSFTSLRSKLIPFQCERIVAELDVRLFPLLPFHEETPENIKKSEHILTTNVPLATIAYYVMTSTFHDDPQVLDTRELFSAYLEREMKAMIANGSTNPGLGKTIEEIPGKKKGLFRMTLDGTLFYHENEHEFFKKDYRFNRNSFSFITCNLYPKNFGRYSNQVKIVLTRKSDLYALPEEEGRKIRFENNMMLYNVGVRIINPYEDTQGEGLWIPDYV